MEKKQTAVQWLREQFHKVPPSQFGNLFEQALQMERQRIIDDFDNGQANHCLPRDFDNGEQYFAKTFNQ